MLATIIGISWLRDQRPVLAAITGTTGLTSGGPTLGVTKEFESAVCTDAR
jgi:hypothetical protein